MDLFKFLMSNIIDDKEGMDATILPKDVNTYKSKTCNYVFERDVNWLIVTVKNKFNSEDVKLVVYPTNDKKEQEIEVLKQNCTDSFKDVAISSLKSFLHERLMQVISKHFDLGFTEDDLKEMEAQ